MAFYGGVRFVDAPCPDNVSRLDTNCLGLISDMHRYGIRLDVPFLNHMSRGLRTDGYTDDKGNYYPSQREIQSNIFRELGNYQDFDGKKLVPFNVGSPDHVSRLLFQHLKIQKSESVALTPKGKRFTTDDDTLNRFRKRHPVVQMILDWRELDKFAGTYTEPLALLVDGNSFLHSWFNVTTVATGRLSVGYVQTIPARSKLGKLIRNAFIAAKGCRLVSADLCFHPDTLIETVYGPKRIASITTGDKVLTLRGNYVKFGEVTKSALVGHLPAYRLTFDNGESVIASSDHKWPVNVLSGTSSRSFIRKEKTTEELVVGEHMVPCKTGQDGSGRQTWYSKGARWYTKKHVLAAEAVYGVRPVGYDVHHKDGNFLNNHPSNLEYKHAHKHKSDHGKENYKKQDHTLRLKKLREGLKKRRPYLGQANPNAKLKDGEWEKILELRLRGCSATWLAAQFGVTEGHIRNLICKQKKNSGKLQNHLLVKKEFVGFQPMHAITVEPDHNYALACGVVTQNSQIEMRWAAHLSQDEAMCEVFHNNGDIHIRTACSIFERDYPTILELYQAFDGPNREYLTRDEVAWCKRFKQEERLPSKTAGFGTLYEVGPMGLQKTILDALIEVDPDRDPDDILKEWPDTRCEQVIAGFYDTFPGIKARQDLQHRRAMQYGMVWDAFGRVRLVPEAKSALKKIKGEGFRKASNHEEQSSAQGSLKVAMARLTPITRELNQSFTCFPSLQVHDQLILNCQKEYAAEFADIVRYEMEQAVKLDVPVLASADTGERWGDL
jgi:DNA polymerase I-like protein with 3'-5' exonuclease and polymerase domains